MDYQTKKLLQSLTTEFYVRTAASFSETRSAPWHGWQKVVDLVAGQTDDFSSSDSLRVLDVGCGNLRFEKYLSERSINYLATCIDNCDDLVELGLNDGSDMIDFISLDVMSQLLGGEKLNSALPCSEQFFDLSCAFGFLHHVPGFDSRLLLMESLVSLTKPEGFIAISFWQFERDERILSRAKLATERAWEFFTVDELEPGDYLLGWQDDESVFRYCHSFSEEEINDLVAALGSEVVEVARFSADGKSEDLNRYVVLKRV